MRIASNFQQARDAVRHFQSKLLTNLDTGITAVLSRTNLDKMLSRKAVSKSENPVIHATAVANIDTLFRHATHGWSKPDRSADPNIIAVHRFFSPMEVDGHLKMVKLTIKETGPVAQNNTIYTLEAVECIDDHQCRKWIEASARADGIAINSAKKIPSGGVGGRDS